jgi:hypothetical protein
MKTIPPRRAASFHGPDVERIDEHRVRCPICGVPVDRRDAEAAAYHLVPGHQPPALRATS